jgi:hypothetical protein
MHLFFLLIMRDFSTFLIKPFETFPVKMQAISLPYPRLAVRLQTDEQVAKLFFKESLGVS